MDISRENIEKLVDNYVFEKISTDFKFREYQKEAIIDIIENILLHKNHNYVVEAPTGSGKSLINIISAGVLADYFDITSYLLVSDLFLWEQYYNFLKSHPNVDIAVMKGSIGNYTCAYNGEDITLADCKLSGLSWSSMYNQATIEKYGYDCAYNCEYVKTRKRALRSKACLMTYQLFIQTFKKVSVDDKNPYQFRPRDVIFCDECHNIPNITETRTHAHMKQKDLDTILTIYDYIYSKRVNIFSEQGQERDFTDVWINKYSRQDIINRFEKNWKILSNPESRKDEDDVASSDYSAMLQEISTVCEELRGSLTQRKISAHNLTKEDLKLFSITNWFWDYALEFIEYYGLIKECGKEYQLKEINEKTSKDEGVVVTFRCLKEDYIVYKYLLTKANFKVMLSATIGGHKAFDENMGFSYTDDKESEMKRIPSTFDFSQSPVHFLNKFKMSLRERELSFQHLKKIVYSICTTKFKTQRGIIQTGSYDIAKKLYEDAPLEIKSRMLVYNGSREKTSMVNIHKFSEDTILVGPTLNEGVDLPGDECRFIIILKVPYPSLGDRYVKEKIKFFPLWYNSTTSNEIIQGIGRGIRYDGDWCVTYIFDACFWNLYLSTQEQYPEELRKRINII